MPAPRIGCGRYDENSPHETRKVPLELEFEFEIEFERMSGSRTRGIALVTGAAIVWSTAGIFVRLLDLDILTMLAWRSLFAALTLACVVVLRYRGGTLRRLKAMGWPCLWAAPIAAISMGSYILALRLTTVANVMVVYATVPIVAAGIAYLWIGERVGRGLIGASLVALIGVLVMAGSASRAQDIAGNAIALLMTLAFGVQLVMARRFPALDMAPANALGSALCALACLPLASGVVPNGHQMLLLVAFATTSAALAYVLFLTGGRYIPSAEAALLGLLDVVLAPLWVWLAFSEEPGGAAIIGGVLVLAPVIWYLLRDGSGRMRGQLD